MSCCPCFSCCKFDVKPPEKWEVEDKRKCTNIPCCIIFIVFWIFFIAIFIYAVAEGEQDRLWYPTDYKGDLCRDNSSYIYYPRINDDVVLFSSKYIPGALNGSFLPDADDIKLFGVCMKACPKLGDIVCTEDVDASEFDRSEHIENCGFGKPNKYDYCTKCWIVPLNTTSILHRCMYESANKRMKKEVCIEPNMIDVKETDKDYISPDDPRCISKQVTVSDVSAELAASYNPLIDQMSTAMFYVGGWLADLNKTKWSIMVTGLLIPIVLGFLFVLLMKWLVTLFVWLVIIGVFVVSILFTVFCLYKGGVIDVYGIANKAIEFTSNFTDDAFNSSSAQGSVSDFKSSLPDYLLPSNNYQTYWEVAGYVMIFVCILVVILFAALYSHIKISIAVIKAASNAVGRIPSIVFLPIITDIGLVCVTLFFIFSAAMMYTAGDTIVNATQKIQDLVNDGSSGINDFLEDKYNGSLPQIAIGFDKSTTSFVLMWFDLFGFLWSQQFLQALLMTSVALAVGTYYYTIPDKNNNRPQKCCSPWKSMCTVMRYHLGSLAFGSFVVAVIQWLRAILTYIDKQTKKLQDGNCLARCCFKICHCCMCCLEKCMKFISRNAYIMIGIRGHGFYQACVIAFKLIWNNMALVGVLSGFTSVLIFLGKVVISGMCACIAYGWFAVTDSYQVGQPDELNNPFIPTLVCLFIAYMVATSFLGVYHMVIDTILLCYCEDSNGHNGASEYTPGPIQDVIGKAKSDAKNKKKGSDQEPDPKPQSSAPAPAPAPAPTPAAQPVESAPPAPAAENSAPVPANN